MKVKGTIRDFLWFVGEREKITARRQSGLEPPWTADFILQKMRFNNLDRNDDYGTRELLKFTFGMDISSTLFYVVMYRCCYSSSNFFRQMTGNWHRDLLRLSTVGFSNLGRTPYQVFLKKDQRIENFLVVTGSDVFRRLTVQLPTFCNESIDMVSNIIADDFCKTHLRRQPFLGTEIAKDISVLFPHRINPDSWCLFNTGAIAALRALPGHHIEDKINNMLILTGFTPSVLEHSLCEWGKYLKRTEYYRVNGKLPHSWIYRPRG